MLIEPCDLADIWAITSVISDGAKPSTSVEVGPPRRFVRSRLYVYGGADRSPKVQCRVFPAREAGCC